MDSCKGLCDVCGKSFQFRKGLYQHLRAFHDVHVDLNVDKEQCWICDKMFSSVAALDRHKRTHIPARQTVEETCDICDKVFSSTAAFNRHKKEHSPAPQRLSCTECAIFTCHTRKELRGHLECEHGLNMAMKEMEFDSWEQFIQWKLKMESDEKIFFTKNVSEKVIDSERSIIYYICHRSGIHTSRSLGKRCRAPSVKIGQTCPASLTVTKMSSGKICVKFYTTHTGHNFSLGSLHLTPADRAMVAGQIAAGVADGEILKRVRDSVSEGFNRLHLLERKDICNIKKEYRLDDSSTHENDAISVHLWAQQQNFLGEDSSVLYYKAQGEESRILSIEDFMLVLMTPFQLEMAKSFVPNKVLIDTTHGTNKYHFHLTTLMTVDEFGVGCPVAFCLSTHIDTASMEVFLRAVKDRVGDIKTEVFMSDDCQTYYNAWCSVMGPCTHRLLCTWHVDQAWRRTLRKKFKDTMDMCNVYKVLKALHFETKIDKFTVMMENFLRCCAEEQKTQEFGIYFRNEYSRRPEMWAYCYRAGLGLNTNMYLEAHHKTLKHCYLSAKTNNRVDKCIQALLHRSRDLLLERAIRLAKGGLASGRIAKIGRSHQAGALLTDESITLIEDDKWAVTSNGLAYIVATADSTCVGCPLSCTTCKVCVHRYLCSCIDFMVKGNMCKHIHAVAVRQTNIVSPSRHKASREEALQVMTENVPLQPSSVATTVNWQAAMLDKIAVLQSMATNVSDEDAPFIVAALDRVIKKTSAAISAHKGNLVAQVATVPHFPLTESKTSANRKCQKQRAFYSVKKENVKQVNSLSAPTPSEIVAIEAGLLYGESTGTESDLTYI